MSCIPFCYHCGRPIDCTDAGMCLLCREKLIEDYRNPSKSTGLNVVHETDFMNKAVTNLPSNTSQSSDVPEKGTNVPKK
jgi:hypothetical protein